MSEDEYQATAWTWQDEDEDEDAASNLEEDMEVALYGHLHLDHQADDPPPVTSDYPPDTWNVSVEEPGHGNLTQNSKLDKENQLEHSGENYCKLMENTIVVSGKLHKKGVATCDSVKSKDLKQRSAEGTCMKNVPSGTKMRSKLNEIVENVKKPKGRVNEVVVIDTSSTDSDVITLVDSESESESDSDSDSDCSVTTLLGVNKEDLEEAGLITNITSGPGPSTRQQPDKEIDVTGLTLQQIHDSLPACDWSVDVQDRFTTVGPAALRSRYYKPIQVLCRNCSTRGHLSRDCPQPKKVVGCIQCGDTSHKVHQCPDPKCWNCQTVGHTNRNCPEPRRPAHAMCLRCGMKGHLKKICTDLWRQFHMTTASCDYPRAVEKKVNPRKYCFNCAKKGHFGYECKLPPSVHNTYAACPFVKRYEGNRRDSPREDVKQSGGKRKNAEASSTQERPTKCLKPNAYAQEVLSEAEEREQLRIFTKKSRKEIRAKKKAKKRNKKAKRLQEAVQGFPRGPFAPSTSEAMKTRGSPARRGTGPHTRQQLRSHAPVNMQLSQPAQLPNFTVQVRGRGRGAMRGDIRWVSLGSPSRGRGGSPQRGSHRNSGGEMGNHSRASRSQGYRGRTSPREDYHRYNRYQSNDRHRQNDRGFFY